MDIQFSEHNTAHHQEAIYFATDSNQSDVYVNEVRNNYSLSQTILYALHACEQRAHYSPAKFIDIGANIGTFTIPLAKAGFKTLAIEALPKNFTLLSEAIRKNSLRNVVAVHTAATEKAGVVTMAGDSAWALINQQGHGIEVPALTIDALTEIYDFVDACVIKIDVEGAEMSVLNGMKSLFKHNPDVDIIFESNAYTCALFGYSVKELKRFFEKSGYQLYCFNDGSLSPHSSDDFQEIVTLDYLATKKDLSSLKPFSVKALSTEEIIDNMLHHLQHSVYHCAYFAVTIDKAPAKIRENERVKSRQNELLANKTPEWNALLELLSVGA